MKRTVIITGLIVVLTSLALTVFIRLTSGKGTEVANITEVKRGNFEIAVSNTGELVPETSIDIKGPNIVQNMNFRVAPVKITDMVQEGTIVRKGGYIASLDRTNFNNTFKDESDIFKTMQTNLEMKLLDSAVTLSTLRDDIRNQVFAVEEASITVDQSKYEPPATQRQAVLALEKEKRYLDWKQRLYNLRYAQAVSEIKNQKRTFESQRRKVTDLGNVLASFTVTAPAEGMVIYAKDRMGAKIKTGSYMNPFNPIIASLPDMSHMLSKIYVSEIDVSKIKKGQPVEVTVDAFSEKKYKGQVTTIANIGEQLSNSDAKVFEVFVKLDGTDPTLRPSMTTSNKVITRLFDNVVFVPIESVQAGEDSIPYVYTTHGTRQVVVLGESNDKNIIVEQGLAAGTSVWLSTPEDQGKFSLAGNELIPIIRERAKARKLELEKERKENNLLSESRSENKAFTISSLPGGTSGSAGTAGGM